MLRLLGIKKDYKVADTKVHALKGIDLEFRRNEFVCILGQSGCGKTTLLNIIGGLDQYTSGDLIVNGKSTKDFKDRDWDVYRNHRIGFIFQSYNLIPHQTVLGNVELALTIAGIGKEERRRRAKEALERVGLGDHLDKRPNQLSGGQMQRVAIARALVNDPQILLADEPTGALDSATSVQIMELIKEIAGERLVIMVTHNPELAEQYASRIVRLKDGLVESDSNPYDGTEDRRVRKEAQLARKAELEKNRKELKRVKKAQKARKKKTSRARMSFITSLSLSARNLLTKKGRTIVTSIAGSIGIISVCLVLALSNGFNNYIRRTEEDMLSYYPLQVTESSLDMASVMSSMRSANDLPDLSKLDDKVYVNSFLTGIANGMAVQNDITEEYVKYIGDMDENLYYAIHYGHGTSLADNIFTQVKTGTSASDLQTRNMSLSALKAYYIEELTTKASQYSGLVSLADYFGNIVTPMPGTNDFSDERFGEYVLSQYDVVKGEFPQEPNEALLVIGGNNDMTDLALAQLGFIDEPTFLSLFNIDGDDKEEGEKELLTIDFDEILTKQFVLYYNDAVYTKNANPLAEYPFEYDGERDNLNATKEEGVSIKVSGILRLKEGLTYGCLTSGLNLSEKFIDDYIAKNMQSEIVGWMSDPNNAIPYLHDGNTISLYRSPARNLNSYYALETQQTLPNGVSVILHLTNNQEPAVRALGGDDTVNSIAFYPKDFETKDQIVDYLDAWNEAHEESEKVTYTDTIGLLMGMVQTMLNAVTYVLVAFTAISLVVSSVMIGIITYVSVVERVKEIGVLRSLGARKRDIKNLFNAETFIIGLSAGVFGVVVTYLLSFAVNAILGSLTGIANLAALPFTTALIMVAVSVVLTLISGLIPASAAAKKDPVIALRTE